MSSKIDQYVDEIISIFMMLMLLLALVSSPRQDADADADEDLIAPISVSVTKASKVATEPLRRPADSGRRLFGLLD